MIEKVILVRYGELFLKGKNKKFFESALISNIKKTLKPYSFNFVKTQGRYFIENFNEEDCLAIADKISKVFGVHSLSIATKVKSDFDEIAKVALEIAPQNGTFRVTCKRADKTFAKNSTRTAADIGGFILQSNPSLSVDLYDAKVDIKIDIRENGFTYVFAHKIKAEGGMPVGTAGSAMLLLSGGIDSPVAGYKMAKRGLQIQAVHFCSPPYTSELAKQKVVDLAKIISDYTGSFNLMVVPFTEIQTEIHQKCKAEFMITIMRRIMVRIAERLAQKFHCGALVTGESLGQVASQTMQSITVVEQAVESMPIFRPLIALDKDEIIDIANQIKTFETSILPYEDCCTVFLPKNPVIKPKLEVAIKEESKLDIEALIESVMSKIEVIKI